VVVAVAAASSGNTNGAVLLGALAFAGFFLAAIFASGYQTLHRRMTRDEAAYRGPSPFLVFGAVFAAANAIALAIRAAGIGELPQSETVLLSVGVVVPLYAVMIWLLVVREGALSWQAMGWPSMWDRSARTLMSFLYGSALALPIVVITAIVGIVLVGVLGVRPPDVLAPPSTPAEWAVDLLVVAALAPIGEELFFRGFAQTAWARDLGWRRALLRAAIFFSIIHGIDVSATDFSEGIRLVTLATLSRLPVALALGWVFVRTGSIAGSIGLHAAYNGVMLLLLSFQ
jgi:membrane protease YdiL (CAAX protease family)